MKIDAELIREILFSIEESDPSRLSSYDEDSLKYHKALLINENLVDGRILPNKEISTQIPSDVFIQKLTRRGHELLNTVRQVEEGTKNKIERLFTNN